MNSLCLKLLVAASLAIIAPFLRAQDGLKGALSQADLTGAFKTNLAVADLDNDKKPDGAVLLGSGSLRDGRFRIQVHFSGHPNAEFSFESTAQALTVSAWDIDNDGNTDLVVEESFTHKPLHVWINEGHGDFHEARVEDFPSLAWRTQEQLQSPANQTDGQVLYLPAQRGFEIATLTSPVAWRLAAKNEPQALSTLSWAATRTRAPNSSRAPPLS